MIIESLLCLIMQRGKVTKVAELGKKGGRYCGLIWHSAASIIVWATLLN